MNQTDLQTLKIQLAATAELFGRSLTPGAIVLMAESLRGFELNAALEALQDCLQTLNRMPTIADIISRIQSRDGFPTPEQAWALLPKDEHSSAAITTEMQTAYGVAHDHLKRGDYIQGRMAFVEVYNKLVKESRDRKQKPKWVTSLGMDQAGRDKAVADAAAYNFQLGHSTPYTKQLENKAKPEELPPVDPKALAWIEQIKSNIAKNVPEEEQ